MNEEYPSHRINNRYAFLAFLSLWMTCFSLSILRFDYRRWCAFRVTLFQLLPHSPTCLMATFTYTVHYSDKRVRPCSAFVSLSQLSWAQSSAPAELIQADSEQQSLLWAAAATAAARPVWTRWWNRIPIKLWQNAVHPVQLIQANTQEINDTHTRYAKTMDGKILFFFPA